MQNNENVLEWNPNIVLKEAFPPVQHHCLSVQPQNDTLFCNNWKHATYGHDC